MTDEMSLVVMSPGAVTTTVDVYVAASSDDAEQKPSGRTKPTNPDLELVQDRGSNQIVGLRFEGLDVPQGAVITNAYVQFQADEKNSEDTHLEIQGEDIDDALPFIKEDFNISARNRTSASVPWNPAPWKTVGEAGPDQRTTNILSVVQEVVNRPGWSSGNAMVLIVTGVGERVAESFDGLQSGAPMLQVQYVTNLPPVAVTDVVQTDEDTVLYGDVLAANPTTPDSDPNGGVLTVIAVDGLMLQVERAPES